MTASAHIRRRTPANSIRRIAPRVELGYNEEGVPIRRHKSGRISLETGKELVVVVPADPDLGAGGYRKGTAFEMAAAAMVKGGFSSTDIMRDLRARFPGKSRNWSVTMSVVTKELIAKGFTLEGWFAAVPPPPEPADESSDDQGNLPLS